MNPIRHVLAGLLLLSACAEVGTGEHDTGIVSREMSAADAPPAAALPAVPAMEVFRPQGGVAEPVLPGTQAVLPEGAAASLIIRSGSATVEVRSVEEAAEQVRGLAARVGGFIAAANVQAGHERQRYARLELKLPAERWDEAVGGLPAIGRVLDVQVNAQDVGVEYVDLTARLENARRFEQRMVELLARRTGNLEEVLAVERELARIREEIERYQGRLRHLRTQVALSTLTVTVQEPQPLVGAYRGASVLADAFRAAWRNFVGFVAGFIAALGIVVPTAALMIVLLLAIRWGWSRMRGSSWAKPRAAASGKGES